MKTYKNGMKATEFTANEIIELAKRINIESWFYNHLMNLAKFYGHDDSKSVERVEGMIIAAISKESTVEAQQIMGRVAEMIINSYGLKRDDLNRTIVGQETEASAEQSIMDKYPTCSINFTEEGCNFKYDNKKNAKTYTYKVNNMIELARRLRVM